MSRDDLKDEVPAPAGHAADIHDVGDEPQEMSYSWRLALMTATTSTTKSWS
jgi:hypothetical protein